MKFNYFSIIVFLILLIKVIHAKDLVPYLSCSYSFQKYDYKNIDYQYFNSNKIEKGIMLENRTIYVPKISTEIGFQSRKFSHSLNFQGKFHTGRNEDTIHYEISYFNTANNVLIDTVVSDLVREDFFRIGIYYSIYYTLFKENKFVRLQPGLSLGYVYEQQQILCQTEIPDFNIESNAIFYGAPRCKILIGHFPYFASCEAICNIGKTGKHLKLKPDVFIGLYLTFR